MCKVSSSKILLFPVFLFTRLRQDAPCGSTGRINLRQRLLLDRDGDRRPRRTLQGACPRPTPKAMADGVRSSATAEGGEARGASLVSSGSEPLIGTMRARGFISSVRSHLSRFFASLLQIKKS